MKGNKKFVFLFFLTFSLLNSCDSLFSFYTIYSNKYSPPREGQSQFSFDFTNSGFTKANGVPALLFTFNYDNGTYISLPNLVAVENLSAPTGKQFKGYSNSINGSPPLFLPGDRIYVEMSLSFYVVTEPSSSGP